MRGEVTQNAYPSGLKPLTTGAERSEALAARGGGPHAAGGGGAPPAN
jgi:hypothetical protein